MKKDTFIKLIQSQSTREVFNLIIYVLLILWACFLASNIFSALTLYEVSILTTDLDQIIFLVKKLAWDLVKFVIFFLSFFVFVGSQWFKNHPIKSYTGSHVAAQLLTVTTVLVGAFVSITSNDINTVIQCHITANQCTENTFTISPIGVAILFIVSFYVIHGKHGSQLKTEREEYENAQSEKLRLAIQVAPPPYFAKKLAEYSDIIEDMAQQTFVEYSYLANETDGYKTPEEGEKVLEEQRKVIRCALMALGRLAQAYDNVDPSVQNEVQYRANLMLCLKSDNQDVSSYFSSTHPSNSIRFEIPFGAQPHFLLYIDKRYSVNVKQSDNKLNQAHLFKSVEPDSHIIIPEQFEIDSSVANATMPIYWQDNVSEAINYNVIGAPRAIIECKPQFINDTIETAKAAGYYSEDIQNEAIKYFTNDKKGRSIVSMPVATRHYELTPEHEADLDRFLGVLNIYRNSENIFSGTRKNFEFFADFTRPLRLVIARMAYTHIDSIAIVQSLKNSNNPSTEE
ncbi:hypothetical protein OIZ54_03335 [Pseudoalteromonas sp. A3]|uniref:hypothetical protein n=1 Tax=Pseudoalteromonas sp. A3 TaxID=142792 RepID=UPI00221F0EFA|nr:hypothetical protein [Pseudoalteromonas sp. A3]MCW1717777.1 hypothetical protein [Pseudoalteromonas sp. A3]